MKKIFAALFSIMLMIAFSACTVDWGKGKVSFDPDLTIETGEGAVVVGGVRETSYDANGIKKLIIESTAGNIKISKGDTNRVEVKTEIKIKSSDKEAREAIAENIAVTEDRDASKITLKPKTKDKGEDPWKWARSEYGVLNLSINFEIQVPSSVEGFAVYENAGDVILEGVDGYADIKLNAGKISLNDVSLKGKNILKFNAGNVNFDGEIDEKASLEISGNAGNVKMKLPGDQRFDLSTSLIAGNISGNLITASKLGGKLQQKFNGGGAKIKIVLNAGNINIDKQ